MSDHTSPVPERTVILEDTTLRSLGGFIQLPNAVLKHPGLSFGAKVVYGVLLSYAWQEDFCWPAQERIAKDTNCSVRQAQRFLTELRDLRAIHWRQKGLNRPNVYYLRPVNTWIASELVGSPDTTRLSPPDTTALARQDTTPVSHKEDSTKKTHHVDVGNDRRRDTPGPAMVKASFSEVQGRFTPVAALQLEPAKADYLVGVIADRLGDHKRMSLRSFRLLVESLGEPMIWELLGSVSESSRDGIIVGNKAAYFMGAAKQVARERGIDLGLKSSRLAA